MTMYDDDDVIFLCDDSGEESPWQILDMPEFEGSTYAVLASLEEDDDSVMIFRVTEDEDDQQYEQIEDEKLIQRVFDLFRSSDEDYEFCDAE